MNPLAILAFARANWKALVGLILGIILCWPVASCSGRADGRAQMRAALVQANIKALAAQRQAEDLASRERLADQRATASLERNLADAVANIPDAVPNARRLARACAQLRSQGLDTANLPQCR